MPWKLDKTSWTYNNHEQTLAHEKKCIRKIHTKKSHSRGSAQPWHIFSGSHKFNQPLNIWWIFSFYFQGRIQGGGWWTKGALSPQNFLGNGPLLNLKKKVWQKGKKMGEIEFSFPLKRRKKTPGFADPHPTWFLCTPSCLSTWFLGIHDEPDEPQIYWCRCRLNL